MGFRNLQEKLEKHVFKISTNKGNATFKKKKNIKGLRAILNLLLDKEHVLRSRQSFLKNILNFFYPGLAFVEKVNRFLL